MNKDKILGMACDTGLFKQINGTLWCALDPEGDDVTREVLAFAEAVRKDALTIEMPAREGMGVNPLVKGLAMDIDSVALRAMRRIVGHLTSRDLTTMKNIQLEVRAALVEFWPSVYRSEAEERERFERATYDHYVQRHAEGKTADKDDPVGTREQLLWRQPNGEYGVLMFNASWWAWKEAVKP